MRALGACLVLLVSARTTYGPPSVGFAAILSDHFQHPSLSLCCLESYDVLTLQTTGARMMWRKTKSCVPGHHRPHRQKPKYYVPELNFPTYGDLPPLKYFLKRRCLLQKPGVFYTESQAGNLRKNLPVKSRSSNAVDYKFKYRDFDWFCWHKKIPETVFERSLKLFEIFKRFFSQSRPFASPFCPKAQKVFPDPMAAS